MFRRFFYLGLFSLMLLPTRVRAQNTPIDTYINRGFATNVQVNARNFVNLGQFVVSTGIVPWDSQNTINFTNRGTMEGSVGFRFETVDPFDPAQGLFGLRHQASSFVNAANA